MATVIRRVRHQDPFSGFSSRQNTHSIIKPVLANRAIIRF